MAKKRAASSADRSRAARLRARAAKGRELSARDSRWLDRYEFRYGRYAKPEAAKKLSARDEALRVVRWVVSYLGARRVRYSSKWGRKSKPGHPGYARAAAHWKKPVLPPEDLPSAIPVGNYHDRLLNVRVRLYVDGRLQWVPILAMTSKWHNVPVDLHDKFRTEYFTKYLRNEADDEEDDRTIGIVGVSVQVSPQRRKHGKQARSHSTRHKKKR